MRIKRTADAIPEVLRQFKLSPIIGAVVATLLGWVLLTFNLGAPVRLASYDWLFALRRDLTAPEVLIVYLDEESFARLDQPRTAPWDRKLHAKLVRRLKDAGARAIVFDIFFAEPGDPAADTAFAEAIKAHGRVVLGADAYWTGERDPTNGPSIRPPFDQLRDQVGEAGWGLVLMDPDYDQAVRRHSPSYPPYKLSLGWVTARLLGAPITQDTNEMRLEATARTERWLKYYGPARHLAHVSYFNALDPMRTPDEMIRDRIVFVGASTLTKFSDERKDAYMSPFSMWVKTDDKRFIAGVEVHATAALNLVRGDWLTRMGWRWECFWVLLTGVSAGLSLRWLRPTLATAAAVLAILTVVLASRLAFTGWGIWFPWLILVLQIAAAWLYAIGANSIRLYVQNRLLQQTVARYLSPKLARKYMRERNLDFLKPGAHKQEVTIFFSDIAGFTTIAEGMDSSELAAMMNSYFDAAVGRCIHPTDGTVVKYIGDAIFAFWNAPDPQPDHAVRACQAALFFQQRATHEFHGRRLVTRIGLHTGVANVGNFGSADRVDYTALGESINLASRLEGLNKHVGTHTLITGETQGRLNGQFVTRRVGLFVLKGFEKSVEIFELVAPRGDESAFENLHRGFAAALAEFQAGRLAEAEAGFRGVLANFPEDGPCRFYVKVIEELRSGPLPQPWKGEVELHEK